jgi:4-amino-4-deoxy-L-arabinose transferase-like glycosyltransferase
MSAKLSTVLSFMGSRTGRLLLGLWLLLLLLCVVRPLAVPDEGRYSEVGRWMLESGDWLVPRLNGIPFFHKPPYLYWLEALSISVLGAVPWATRLIVALHAGAMLLGLYMGASRIWGEPVALRACWMLGTSLAFLVGGQYVNHDMLVASWIGLTVWLLGLAFMAPQGVDIQLARWGMVCAALGFMSKGLIGVVLPGGVIFFWLLATGQWKKMLQFPWFSALAILALIVTPWFVLVERQHPGMFAYMFGHHQVGRFGATTFNNARPWWFYWAGLFLLLFPWAFMALRTLWLQARHRWTPENERERLGLALMWAWLLTIVGFFSIPNSKLIGYVLPVMPPLAVLSALGWASLTRNWKESTAQRGLIVTGLLAAVLAVAVTFYAGQYTRQKAGAQDLAQALACRMQATDRIYALGQYPYDLPFYLRAKQPLIVIQDWEIQRKTAGDNWRREMFEGADFDAQAAQSLQSANVLPGAASRADTWLVASGIAAEAPELQGWVPEFKGHSWTLYRTAATQARQCNVQ